MEFVVFDTEKRFKEFMNKDNESLNIKISEMHLVNKNNFWFETDFKTNNSALSIDERYVHINPNIDRIKRDYTVTDTIRLTPLNFKYHYNSSYLVVFKKSWLRNKIIKKKKIMTRFIRNPRKNIYIPVNGNMYYNTSNDIIYVILEYYK